jgi:hypothetical protein
MRRDQYPAWLMNPEDGSQDRSASDGGSEDGEAARSDLNNKTSFPKGMPRD